MKDAEPLAGAVPDPLLTVAVRAAHLLAAGIAVGGALLAWALASRGLPLAVAERYEWTWWAAAGLLVVTGVGNLGALGAAAPAAGTAWGDRFLLKLGGVLLALGLSLARTIAVARLLAAGRADVPPRLATAYAATAILLAAVLGLGVMLAHG